MKIDCFLVLGKTKQAVRVRRVTQKRPWLDADEAMVRLQLDIPDDAFEAPLLTVPIGKNRIAVGIEVDEPV